MEQMNFGFLNALAITLLALLGLWIFGRSVVRPSSDRSLTEETSSEKD